MNTSGSDAGEYRYRPAWWLPGGHAQTLWGKFARVRRSTRTSSECLSTPDGDAIELHHLPAPQEAPRVLLLHGLEGSAKSHYVGGLLAQALRRSWGATLMLFRGCGSAPNTARRFYHSGETSDLEFVFSTLRQRWPASPWFMVGVSLGGNVLLKWLGERGDTVDERIRRTAAVSVPFDLEAGARKISRGVARIYDRSFLRSLRRKAVQKLLVYPDLFDRKRLAAARTVFDFDDAVTAPVHGFAGATDYYERSSSLAFLSAIRAPTLLLSSADDPFLPAEVLERARTRSAGNPHLRVEFLASGGHVGFVAGAWPWRARYFAEERVFRFFDSAMEHGSQRRYD